MQCEIAYAAGGDSQKSSSIIPAWGGDLSFMNWSVNTSTKRADATAESVLSQ
jgi:hypothetical protein